MLTQFITIINVTIIVIIIKLLLLFLWLSVLLLLLSLLAATVKVTGFGDKFCIVFMIKRN